MGLMTAIGINEIEMPLVERIAMHLRVNFYPPIPAEMAESCAEAIDAYWEEDTDRLISLPEINGFQVEWRGQTSAPAYAILEQHRLYGFIEEDEYSDYYDDVEDYEYQDYEPQEMD